MKKTVTISIYRHGDKDGDKLTDLGKWQIKEAVEINVRAGFKYDLIGHSPLNRTTECAWIARDVIGDVSVEPFEGLNPTDLVEKAFNPYTDEAFGEEFSAITAAGGTVADALKISKYAKMGRSHLRSFLVKLAREMEKDGLAHAICFSHSPYVTLATSIPETTPYDISVAGMISYEVDPETGEIK